MQIWMEVSATQPGCCQVGSLCLVSGMDKENCTCLFHCRTAVSSVCFMLKIKKIKNIKQTNWEIMSPHSSIRIQETFSIYSELTEGKFLFIKEVIYCLAV